MSARFYIVHDDRNVAEIDAQFEESQGFTVQSSASDYKDLIGVQCNPDGSVTVGHWPDGEVWVVMGTAKPNTGTCRHCQRAIEKHEGRWVDPEATGDDSVWRETCDAHDTFVADHEPVEG